MLYFIHASADKVKALKSLLPRVREVTPEYDAKVTFKAITTWGFRGREYFLDEEEAKAAAKAKGWYVHQVSDAEELTSFYREWDDEQYPVL